MKEQNRCTLAQQNINESWNFRFFFIRPFNCMTYLQFNFFFIHSSFAVSLPVQYDSLEMHVLQCHSMEINKSLHSAHTHAGKKMASLGILIAFKRDIRNDINGQWQHCERRKKSHTKYERQSNERHTKTVYINIISESSRFNHRRTVFIWNIIFTFDVRILLNLNDVRMHAQIPLKKSTAK